MYWYILDRMKINAYQIARQQNYDSGFNYTYTNNIMPDRINFIDEDHLITFLIVILINLLDAAYNVWGIIITWNMSCSYCHLFCILTLFYVFTMCHQKENILAISQMKLLKHWTRAIALLAFLWTSLKHLIPLITMYYFKNEIIWYSRYS